MVFLCWLIVAAMTDDSSARRLIFCWELSGYRVNRHGALTITHDQVGIPERCLPNKRAVLSLISTH